MFCSPHSVSAGRRFFQRSAVRFTFSRCRLGRALPFVGREFRNLFRSLPLFSLDPSHDSLPPLFDCDISLAVVPPLLPPPYRLVGGCALRPGASSSSFVRRRARFCASTSTRRTKGLSSRSSSARCVPPPQLALFRILALSPGGPSVVPPHLRKCCTCIEISLFRRRGHYDCAWNGATQVPSWSPALTQPNLVCFPRVGRRTLRFPQGVRRVACSVLVEFPSTFAMVVHDPILQLCRASVRIRREIRGFQLIGHAR